MKNVKNISAWKVGKKNGNENIFRFFPTKISKIEPWLLRRKDLLFIILALIIWTLLYKIINVILSSNIK